MDRTWQHVVAALVFAFMAGWMLAGCAHVPPPSTDDCPSACARITQMGCPVTLGDCTATCERIRPNDATYVACLASTGDCSAVDLCDGGR